MAATIRDMPRAHRLHAPGAGTHITARLQGGAPLFTETVRDAVASLICEAAQFNGVQILALVVMPNHFHIVARQGGFPLGWMMQCAMQRTSLLIRRNFGGQGHVFGRRYWSCICDNPDYLRQAILYTHLNPWKAGLCRTPADYRWSSHQSYARAATDSSWAQYIAVQKGRLLFANETFEDDDVVANYDAFLDFAKVRYLTAVPGDRFLYDWSNDWYRPCAPKGDQHWTETYSHAVPQHQVVVQKRDLRDRAVDILKAIAPSCSLDDVRSCNRSRKIVKIRRDLIAVLITSGYRGSAIARCLFVSPALISRVAAEIRYGQRHPS